MLRKLGYKKVPTPPTASDKEKLKFWQAIRAADVEGVTKFVTKYGKDKSSMQAKWRGNLLTHACRYGAIADEEKFKHHMKIVEILLTSPVIDVNGTDFAEPFEPPLFSAIRNYSQGKTDALKLLLNDSRVDKNIIISGKTALHLAVNEKNAAANVAMLVACEDVNVNTKENESGKTALHFAAHYKDVSMTNILLGNKNIDVNARDAKGNPAAHVALERRNSLTARNIIQRADFLTNSQGENNETALVRAVIIASQKTVDLLLSKPDIDINLATSTGNTPLTCAVRYGHEKIFDKLMARPEIDIRAKDKKGNEALHYAVEKHNFHALTALLLRPEIDVNARDSENVTPLFLAAAVNDIDAATLLLAATNIDVNAVCDDGTTALAAAALHNNALLIRLLLEHGADPTHIDHLGRTARMIAADKMHFGIASLLTDASDAWKIKSSTPLQKNSLMAKSRDEILVATTVESSPSPKL